MINKHRQAILDQGLDIKNLDSDPLIQLSKWLECANQAGIRYPGAMSLATTDFSGSPTQRMVMLREISADGLVFFTSLSSNKAEHIKRHSQVSVLFPWHMLERQVVIRGCAEKIAKNKVLKAFLSRSDMSQTSAWLSDQNSPVTSRGLIEAKLNEIRGNAKNGKLGMPAFWGGYMIKPESVEFWQTGKDGINDRILYRKDQAGWILERLNP